MSVSFGIDLGTTSIKIYSQTKGVILDEPTIVSVNTNTGKVMSYGNEAKSVMGKTPGDIKVVAPIVDGVIADFDLAEQLLSHYIKIAVGNRVFKPHIAISVPTGTTDVELKAVLEAASSSGMRKIFLVENPLAAAIGADFDLSEPYGKMIINIGGGISDAAIFSLNGIVAKSSIKVGGRHMDEALIRYVKDKYNVLLGTQTAEYIKINHGNVYESQSHVKISARGRNLITGLPETIEISELETFIAYHECIYEIAKMIQSVVEKTPPELVSDVSEYGIRIAGGGALLKGMVPYLENYLQSKVVLVDDPINCVVIGTGNAYAYRKIIKDGFINITK